MQLSKGAKPILKALVVIYAIAIIVFLVQIFTAKESPVKEDAVTELVALSKRLKAEDPKAKELSKKEAEAIFDDALLEPGPVIGFNYTNFTILLVAMYGLLWDPMIRFLDERRNAIRTDIETAKEGREKAEALRAEVEDELKKTRDERREIIDTAEREAAAEREKELAEGRTEAAAMIERAKREIEAHVAAGKTELRQEIARLSVELAQRIIDREIKEQDHAVLVSQFIQEIEDQAKEGDS